MECPNCNRRIVQMTMYESDWQLKEVKMNCNVCHTSWVASIEELREWHDYANASNYIKTKGW